MNQRRPAPGPDGSVRAVSHLELGGDGEARAVGEAAHVLPELDVEVAVDAPVRAPAVLDDVVRERLRGKGLVEAHSQHCVVHLRRQRPADGARVDAARVVTEVRGNLWYVEKNQSRSVRP